MSEAAIEQQQVRVRVEDDTHGIYIGAGAIEAVRSEANGQAHERIKEAVALWDELDVEDLDAIKECEFKFALARAALATLRWLAPIPDDDPVA